MLTLKIEKLPKARTTVTVEVPADIHKTAEQNALRKLASRVNLPGFRPGKAPADMVREKIDPQDLLKETVRDVLPQVMKQAVDEAKVAPILPPSVQIVSENPLKISVLFIETPEAKVSGIDKLKMEKKPEITVDAKEMQQFIRQLTWHDRRETEETRGAQNDDIVKMDLKATDDKSTDIAGLTQKDYRVLLGTDDLLPDLTKALAGMKTGEEKTVKVTLPKDFNAPELQGKKVTFGIKVTSVASATTPEITADYLKQNFSVDKTPDEFRKDIEAMLKDRKSRDLSRKREQEFFDMIQKATKVDLPDELIDAEVQAMIDNLHQRLQKDNMTMEDWLKSMNKKPDEIVTDLKKTATDRLTMRFGLQQLIKHKEIKIDDAQIAKLAKEAIVLAQSQGHTVNEAEYQPGENRYEQIRSQHAIEKLMEMYGV